MKIILCIVSLFLLLITTGCVNHIKHQGNVLKPERVAQLNVGDARVRVEMLLGTPILKDVTQPNRALYIEDFEDLNLDDDSKKSYQRMVDIHYDRAWRVSHIETHGFDTITE
ncbi:MAG: outer membrane protein assembly factor BamE [Mariprofundales bacterium]